MKRSISIALCLCVAIASLFIAVPGFKTKATANDVNASAKHLLVTYNNNGYYTKETQIFTTATGKDFFHAGADELIRRTTYTPGRLYMTTATTNGGYKDVGDNMVRFHVEGGVEKPDFTVYNTSVEKYFTDLAEMKTLGSWVAQQDGSYVQTFGEDTERATKWRDFVAPMWIGSVEYNQVVMYVNNNDLVFSLCNNETEFAHAVISLPAAEPVAGQTLVETCTFSSITGSVQYATETHEITDHVSMDIQDCHINTQLRIYSSSTNNGTAIFKVEAPYTIKSIAFNAGYKADTLVVEGSVDGEEWEAVQSVATATSYKDYTVNFPENKDYTYFKLDVQGTQQVRIAKITITLEEPSVGGCDHSYSEERVNATCTEAGSSRVICNLCGKESTEILNPNGHKWSAYVVTQEATCEEAGSKIRTCETCEITEKPTVIEAKGHKEKEIVTQEATCTATGLAYRQCSVCEKITEEDVVISKIAHNYENGACTVCGGKDPNAGEEKVTVSLTFDANKANRTSFSTTKQVWSQNGITFTNDKASSTNAVADYGAPVRLYQNSSIAVEALGKITQIVFDCNSSSYATALKNSIGTVSGATVTVSSDKVTVTFATSVDSFTIEKLTAQVRLDSITVTYLG